MANELMEGEISNCINAWLQVIISLSYCYVIGKTVPKGYPTFLAILPIMCVFLALPLSLHSMHLCGALSFFISWLAIFKLMLFALGKGPLSDPSLSLKQFVVVASLPIKINHQNSPPNPKSPPMKTRERVKWLLNYTIKSLAFAGVVKAYEYSENFHPVVLYYLYCTHLYLVLEIILAIASVLARTLLGVELQRQFNEPYLSSSLQDFWGRRWNLMATDILRPTVYEPTQRVAMPFFGPKWASLPARFVTFIVSGLIHELIFYYLGRVQPTWEIMWFFILHGSCLCLEVYYKKKFIDKFRLPRVVSGPLTVGFVMVTAYWLFFPQLLRCNGIQRALQEYVAVGAFVKKCYYSYVDALVQRI